MGLNNERSGVCRGVETGAERRDPPHSRSGTWWLIAPFSLLAQMDSFVHALIHLFTCSQQTVFFGQLLHQVLHRLCRTNPTILGFRC